MAGAGGAAVLVTVTVIATHHASSQRLSATRHPVAIHVAPSTSSSAVGSRSGTPAGHPGHLLYATGQRWHALSANGSAATTLPISNPVCCTTAALSPDGSKLLYTGEGALFVSDARGAGARLVWSSGVPQASAPVWSPDSTRIAFAVSKPSTAGPLRSEILTIRSDGSGLTPVAVGVNVQSIAWSPDGTRLAFTQNQGDIWVVDAAGGRVASLFGAAQGEGPDELPNEVAWGSRGTILFWEIGQDPAGIWAVDADGRHPRVVLPGARKPSFAPDGVHFAAIANGRIVLGATDGSRPRVLAPRGVTAVQWGG
jgi:dipeptidyl aminopeptidase/acylaminoacyl peptidase